MGETAASLTAGASSPWSKRMLTDLHRTLVRLPLLGGGFQRLRIALKDRVYRQTFQAIYEKNTWGDPQSVSGEGSTLTNTEVIRRELPKLARALSVHSMLDIPCGDFCWMKTVALELEYTGGDIVQTLVEGNQRQYGDKEHTFALLDLLGDPLPKVDLILCRDGLVHLSFHSISRAFANMRRSGSTYLLTTTFTERTSNDDIATGDWRPINLQLPPFNLPAPLLVIDEACRLDGYGDKHLGLWKMADC